MIDFSASGIETRIKPANQSESQVEFKIADGEKGKVLDVTFKPGPTGYPGLEIKPEGGKWDLSAFGHVEAQVSNIGQNPMLVALRIDNAGDWKDNPWNTEQANLKPGETKVIKLIFGYQYGQKPGYALNPSAIVNVLLFTGKVGKESIIRLESFIAAGPAGEKPPVDPKTFRIKPKDGVILGTSVTGQALPQVDAKGVQGSIADGALKVVMPGKGEQSVSLKLPAGCWDLSSANEIRFKIKNEGTSPITPKIQLSSNGGPSDLIIAPSPIAAGAEHEMIVPFAPTNIWTGIPNSGNKTSWDPVKGTGTKFGSDAVSGIKISADHSSDAAFTVKSIVATVGVAVLPEWLGKRPPVEGDWTMTFDEEFDGKEIDMKKWNIYGPNYWDKKSHWTKDNLILGNGVVKFKFEKKRGFHNDDPNEKKPQNLSGSNESDYACGYLDSYGKWVQRYGYFEARVKLPVAPGLWPTFWMMPDRGAAAGPQWKRANTGDGAMEFDIMEHLTRWGPYRHNIAFHWDGYGKEHKQTGTGNIYVQPDKDGFITCGMLWIPGKVIYYSNGREIARWEADRISTVPSHFIFEVTTGGWDNNAVDDSKLPVDYVVDYVKAWQRKDLASDVDGYREPAKVEPKPEVKTEVKTEPAPETK
ncbi:MAG: hypothetical protein A2X48_18090 [Lentisphaerae bacterium GWF2_49_21]|nr:MAG: hypothetical protein A2X48_18090 [Lentisphaerae bacterium GWF2_49_21]